MANVLSGQQIKTDDIMSGEGVASLGKNHSLWEFIYKISVSFLIQLIIGAIVVVSVECCPWLHHTVSEHLETLVIFFAVSVLTMPLMMCWSNIYRQFPISMITIGLCNACTSIIIGFYSIFSNTEILIVAIGITIAIPAYRSVYAYRNSIQLSIFAESMRIAHLTLLICLLMGVFQPTNTALLILAYSSSVVFSFYFIHDAHMIIADYINGLIGPDDYVTVVMSLILDITNLFTYVFITLDLIK